jgi:hypothetical protein
MNTTKLSALLLLTSANLIFAAPKQKPEPKKEVTKPEVTQAPKKSFYEGGKECGALLVKAMKSNDHAGLMAYEEKTQSVVGPIVKVLQRGDTTSAEAKAAWNNFQEFNRGLKEVFEKDTPKAPTNLSSIEKQGLEFGIEATKISYNLVLSSSNFAAYAKAMQEKAQDIMAKQMKIAEEYQQQMAANAPQPKPAEAVKK